MGLVQSKPDRREAYLLQAAVGGGGLGNTPHLLAGVGGGSAGRGGARARRAGGAGGARGTGRGRDTAAGPARHSAAVDEVEVILVGAVGEEEAPVQVELGRRLALILVVQADNVGDELGVGAHGRAAVVHGELHQVLVVGERVGEARGRLAVRRPPGLGHRHVDVGVVELLHGRDHGVHLRVVERVIHQTVVGIHDGRGGLEERVVEGDRGLGIQVRQEGVHVDHERRLRLLQKREHGLHRGRHRGPELACGGRIGDVQEADAVRGAHFHGGVVAHLDERRVDVLHSRDEQGPERGGVREHLGADGDGVDVGLRDVGHHVLVHPVVGGGLRQPDGGNLVVGDADHHADLRAGERLDHARVVVVDSHARDLVLLHERRGGGGGRDVVAIAPVDGADIGRAWRSICNCSCYQNQSLVSSECNRQRVSWNRLETLTC